MHVGSYPWGVAVNPAETKVYVANSGSNTVSVIDTVTNTVAATVKVGNSPSGIDKEERTLSPHALFKAYPLRGRVPLTVTFTDQSTGSPTSYLWNFDDKSTPSTARSPVHKYAKAGKYTVSLTVKNKAGIILKRCLITSQWTSEWKSHLKSKENGRIKR